MWTSIKFSAAEHTHTFLIWFIVNWLCYAAGFFFGNFKWLKIRKRGLKNSRYCVYVFACMCLYLCACFFWSFLVKAVKRRGNKWPGQPSETHSQCEYVCVAHLKFCVHFAHRKQKTRLRPSSVIWKVLYGIYEFGSGCSAVGWKKRQRRQGQWKEEKTMKKKHAR